MGSMASGATNVSMSIALSSLARSFDRSPAWTTAYSPLEYSYPETISSFGTSPWTGHTFLYRMRWLHLACSRWNPIFPPPAAAALNALTGMEIRLKVRNPSQLGRAAIGGLLGGPSAGAPRRSSDER